MFMGAFGTLITHKPQQTELPQLALTLRPSSAMMPRLLSFRNSFWCPLFPGVPSPSPARLPHSPRRGSCVSKPKDQTQPPPSTNARPPRPISEIAADCCACGQRFSLLGNLLPSKQPQRAARSFVALFWRSTPAKPLFSPPSICIFVLRGIRAEAGLRPFFTLPR